MIQYLFYIFYEENTIIIIPGLPVFPAGPMNPRLPGKPIDPRSPLRPGGPAWLMNKKKMSIMKQYSFINEYDIGESPNNSIFPKIPYTISKQ